MRDFDRVYTDYIPDITERYPEGFNGVNTLLPRDREYEAWSRYVRDCEQDDDSQEGVRL